MRTKNAVRLSLAVAMTFAFASLLVPGDAQTLNVSKTAMAGTYSVTLKVLPAESFSGPKAEMVRDSGAEPNTLNGPVPPNHHMVAFVVKSDKPVEDATVAISYRELSPKRGKWMSLPVARMHVADKSLETTHYGNNVKLGPGSYEARVTVNGKGPATVRFSL
ncbi:MAG: hypothetical protein ACRETA_14035 [Gammaproteobacteria bacterium]